MTTKTYPNLGLMASQLGKVRDYLGRVGSRSLGDQWGHDIYWYKLYYSDGEKACKNFDEVRQVISERGDTDRHHTYFQSKSGRKLGIDASKPRQVVLEVENGALTNAMIQRVEEIMGIAPYLRKIFITHGQGHVWREVANFIEKEAHPQFLTLELASRPNMGRTIIEKLEEEAGHCSFAVVVMTGDDLAHNEIRARENVIHEIGFFQGRYGRSRVCLLHEEGVNIPSNLSGVVYSAFPKGRTSAAFIELQRELRAAFPD